MNNITKALLTILAMAAVMVYSALNYVNGKIDRMYLIVIFLILGIPMVNMINLVIQELKKK